MFFFSDGIVRVFIVFEERFVLEEELKVSLLLVNRFLFLFFVKLYNFREKD